MNQFNFGAGLNKNKNEDCETCTDFKDWLSQSEKVFENKNEKKKEEKKQATFEINANEKNVLDEAKYMNECPLMRNQFGKVAWSYLHTMAAYYPDSPTDRQKKSMSHFINGFAQFFPCKECSEDFKDEIEKSPPKLSNSYELSQWFCEQHNLVNRKLGKNEFDCSKVLERWKLGKSKNPKCDSFSL